MQYEDIERELRNWALWRSASGWHGLQGSCNISSVYSPTPTRYRESFVPVLSGVACDVDTIIGKLASELRQVLHAEYLNEAPDGRRIPASFTQAQAGRLLGISERTFKRRLEDARQAVGERLTERRLRAEALRPSRVT